LPDPVFGSTNFGPKLRHPPQILGSVVCAGGAQSSSVSAFSHREASLRLNWDRLKTLQREPWPAERPQISHFPQIRCWRLPLSRRILCRLVLIEEVRTSRLGPLSHQPVTSPVSDCITRSADHLFLFAPERPPAGDDSF